MQTMPGRPRRSTRLARALGLDGNPLRRVSDRAEAWIRIGLVAVVLIAGPLAALGVGGWAHHAGSAVAPVQAAPAHHVKAVVPATAALAGLRMFGEANGVGARSGSTAAPARPDGVLAGVMTLAFMAFALQAA